MADSKKTVKQAIQQVIKIMMDRVMDNVLVNDPFLADQHKANKPLYAALVPDEIFKGSHFERRFVTPFGGVWEKLARVVATNCLGRCEIGYSISGKVGKERLRRISEILNKLEHKETGKNRTVPNWEEELNYVLKGGGAPVPVRVLCDVYAEDHTIKGEVKKYAFELKAPLPNSDQTKVSKEKIFKLFAMEPRQVDGAFYALPYNPYGKREDYDWPFPARWFNMKTDPVVLIGNEFWDMLGGKGTYKLFISELNKLGVEYKERIYREYLGIDPPKGSEMPVLK